ncbi:hypothetical protein NQ318_000033 [Aromia moschata]|uniref:C2H2-type domain-containing protein n=1 Tax=Aromia moschata TaxID=1265417 RepID=A0AAV8YCC0_9CUCU|nr:hypothetical protein NQ318_000033 [Aromia moschata]
MNKNKLQTLLGNPKDKTDNNEKSGIYEISCKDCDQKMLNPHKINKRVCRNTKNLRDVQPLSQRKSILKMKMNMTMNLIDFKPTEEICRFCLKTIEKPIPIDEMVKEIIDILMLNLDLRITPEPVMCYGCAETLKTAFDFKSACIYTEDCLYPFIEGKNETKLDLREVYLKVNDSEDIEGVEGREVCRFCMKPSDSGFCTPVEVIDENVEIKKLLENYLPELSASESEPNLQAKGEVEEVEEKKNKEKATIYRCKLCPFKTKLKYCLTRHMLVHKDISEAKVYRCKLCPYKTKWKENLPKHMLVHKDISEITAHRCKLCPYKTKRKDNLLKHMLVHKDVSEITIHRCKSCPYKSKWKSALTKHILVHKDISEVTAHRCKLCPYETKRRTDLVKHMLVHKDHSEVTTYDSIFCSYIAKRKGDLNRHMLTHKDNHTNASEIETSLPVKLVEAAEKTIYNCKRCPYKAKFKCKLIRHMLVHKDISEVTTYDCSFCSYKTKRKTDLPKHMLIHKDFSEVTTYDCNVCSQTTKHKNFMRKHMLTHQDKPKDAKSAQTQEESMSEHQEFEGCSTIKSEEVDIKDEEDECDDESNKL